MYHSIWKFNDINVMSLLCYIPPGLWHSVVFTYGAWLMYDSSPSAASDGQVHAHSFILRHVNISTMGPLK